MAPHVMDSGDKKENFKDAIWIDGAIIVGAGPSGLAAAACLKVNGVPSILLERADCIGSFWKNKTYDRLCLHIPKRFCELPYKPFPDWYPTYPDRHQFLDYLEDYVQHFAIEPHFNEAVQSARYDDQCSVWRVHTIVAWDACEKKTETYIARWLIVASGENAEDVMPELSGMKQYQGDLRHSSSYKNGAEYTGQKVLVVGRGNSGMEIALDLVTFDARPSLVVQGPVHVLPRDIFGQPTFTIAMNLMKTFSTWFTDWVLLFCSWLILGNVANYGLKRPKEGPMELKAKTGRTPVLDVGTLEKVKSGHIKVVPGIVSLTPTGVRYANGRSEACDAIILATGYRSNVTTWLRGEENNFTADGFPNKPALQRWKGEKGLYTVGLGKRGLWGIASDARKVAEDVSAFYHLKK